MTQLGLALAAAQLALLSVRPAEAAERVKFDFSWRFFLGDVPGGGGGGNCSAVAFRSTGSQICGKRGHWAVEPFRRRLVYFVRA